MVSKEVKNIGIIVGNKIRKIRDTQGISQEELAARAEVHRTYISHVECATRNITIYVLVKIAKALKVHPSDLLKEL